MHDSWFTEIQNLSLHIFETVFNVRDENWRTLDNTVEMEKSIKVVSVSADLISCKIKES